jgi:hypothetical protein
MWIARADRSMYQAKQRGATASPWSPRQPQARFGNLRVEPAPLPTSLSARDGPAVASAMCFTIARPRTVPPRACS